MKNKLFYLCNNTKSFCHIYSYQCFVTQVYFCLIKQCLSVNSALRCYHCGIATAHLVCGANYRDECSMQNKPKEIAAVLGGGSFGTAMATILAENGHEARLWVRDAETAAAINEDSENAKYLPGSILPSGVRANDDLIATLKGATLIFVAVPSRAFIEVLAKAKDYVPEGTIVVSCTKGIAADSFKLMSQVLMQQWPQARVGVLSGPNLAKEIVDKRFT